MAIGETMVTLVGTMTSDITVKRVGQDRRELAIFWARSDERRFDRRRQEWVPGRRFSVRVVCHRALAASAAQALRRGDPVVVNGRLHTGDPDVDGSRAQLELEAFALGPNLAQCGVSLRRGPGAEPDVPSQIPLWDPACLTDEALENRPVGARAPVLAGPRGGQGP
ncbi:single-stranded DNA-binding protein [Amycolatopsis thermalba]|uniref:Single-stranded DNA-binding protein n=1 Tax=Amycolatopsis thermalba TaxID=944492 RepID=A0ABY4NTC2_9PSEU|nr:MULTISPECIES: single-stranded DNA-binding protein [Amycolatopsis]UQS23326.1 single-stranded DNA-binding protein [Amycolatopsis thermalba]